jgi:hypothetical protein
MHAPRGTHCNAKDGNRAHRALKGQPYVSPAQRAGSAAGRVVRFWATPENEAVWTQLRSAGVDLINTDHLDRLAAFLSTEPGVDLSP